MCLKKAQLLEYVAMMSLKKEIADNLIICCVLQRKCDAGELNMPNCTRLMA